jgi:hypothetical protein
LVTVVFSIILKRSFDTMYIECWLQKNKCYYEIIICYFLLICVGYLDLFDHLICPLQTGCIIGTPLTLLTVMPNISTKKFS